MSKFCTKIIPDFLLCLFLRHFILRVLVTKSSKYPPSPLLLRPILVWASRRWTHLSPGYLTTPTLSEGRSPRSFHLRAWSCPRSPSPEIWWSRKDKSTMDIPGWVSFYLLKHLKNLIVYRFWRQLLYKGNRFHKLNFHIIIPWQLHLAFSFTCM